MTENETLTSHDFLMPEMSDIRHQVRGILDSYSHDWDILSELLQNSVDAIRERASGRGQIEITIDASLCTIEVNDNGTGIVPEEIPKLLRPYSTNKRTATKSVGEKGVGLKFVMFSSSQFRVETSNEAGSCVATVSGARAWLNSIESTALKVNVTEDPSLNDYGTKISLKLDDPDHPILLFSFLQLLFLIRTKTACGDCGFIWNSPLKCGFTLIYRDKAGEEHRTDKDCRYLLPTEHCNSSDFIDVDDYKEWNREATRSDVERRRKLLNKIVVSKGKKTAAGREIRYWSCIVPRREVWKTLSRDFGLDIPDDTDLPSDEESLGLVFSGGFTTSTKGMPTGISLELKPRGSAGYVPNFFMLADDPSLNFDIGRKSIHGRQQKLLKDIAYEQFREYIRVVRKYMGGAKDPEASQWDRDEVFEEIDSLPNLESEFSRFAKRPNGQEATVVALFFELLGRGYFPEVVPLISGYKGRYDLYAKWKKRRITVEFKYDLAGLLADFSDERKMFDEINVVTLWSITEKDRTIAARRGLSIDPVQRSAFGPDNSFPNSTKQLGLGDANPIYLVELSGYLAGDLDLD